MRAIPFPATPGSRSITGVVESVAPWLTAQIILEHPAKTTFLVAQNLQNAERWLEETRFYLEMQKKAPAIKVHAFPTIPDSDPDDPRVFEHVCDRLAVLTDLAHTGKSKVPQRIIATTAPALFDTCPSPESLTRHEIKISAGEEISLDRLKKKLAEELGYDSEVVCEQPGQFAIRGGLLDIYPLNASGPHRIDFFGDEIESIRPYNPTTQRSSGNSVKQLVIASGESGETQERPGALIDYLKESTRIILYDPAKIAEQFPSAMYAHEDSKFKTPSPHFGDLVKRTTDKGVHVSYVAFSEVVAPSGWFPEPIPQIPIEAENLSMHRTFPEDTDIGADRFTSEQAARIEFLEKLRAWEKEGFALTIVTNNAGEASRLKEIISSEKGLKGFKPQFREGPLRSGCRFINQKNQERWLTPDSAQPGWIVATDSEIFGRYRKRLSKVRQRKLPQKNRMDQALDFSELADGDPLVHLQHGICLFRGLTQMEVRGRNEEVISLEFAEAVTLHLPLHESHLLSRYVGLSKTSPKLGKLGSASWEKTRQAAEKATLDLAADLLRLQAVRDAEVGTSHEPDGPWQKEFEESFLYKETPDQLTAIRETKSDMERARPMDRLICGDVGFGKTEVAIRSAFKAVIGGKQVAMLVPTTVLCQQHFNTFKERMADYPVTVEMVSRFRSPKQNRQIIAQAATGKVDILIGTHRLLSQDVHFKDLGLLVVDEEQRFGVRHKERLKQMKAQVDVLTLSATPIPRTLYMALVGAREMSVIETAPVDRLPIQTLVKGFDKKIISSAINQEIGRGGQVFFLHNRVSTIDRVVEMIEDLVPTARVGMGHGQMDEGMLERVMTKFVAHEYDVLVCTTIIESGIDIPNCNTIIIDNAERFGLSQLYQIRGRVGRFKRQAYAYLLINPAGKLMDDARKRLSALRQYNKLGSGYRIAMRDLELRGAGNLLGSEQSGHIAGVGFDLYCQLLRQSVSRLKGEKGADFIRAKVQLDFILVGETGHESGKRSAPGHDGFSAIREAGLKKERIEPEQAYIPHFYIEESRLRIDVYRRLAMANNSQELKEIAEELKDRFGDYPKTVKTLLHLTEIRTLAEHADVDLVEAEGSRLKCRLAQKTGKKDAFIMVGSRFPRLTGKDAFSRMTEIKSFLLRHQKAK
ncbi:MAG: transcription-repair coupling factor [Opitutales bacterium]